MVATVSAQGLMSGQSFADAEEIVLATRVTTKQLNLRAKPWGFGVVYRSPDGTGGVPLYTVLEERSISKLTLTECVDYIYTFRGSKEDEAPRDSGYER
jgi:hypothetical protein